MLAAPSADYFQKLPSQCIHPSLLFPNEAIRVLFAVFFRFSRPGSRVFMR